jgi:hypothetical protein
MKTHLLDTGSKSLVARRTKRDRDLSFVAVLVLEDVQDVVRRILISS